MRTIEWKDGQVVTVDQTKLPHKTKLLRMTTCREVAEAIKCMQIRGAPLLGAAAAYGLALTAHQSQEDSKSELMNKLKTSAALLRQTRPTAVNLFWALDRVLRKAEESKGDGSAVADSVIREAQSIADEDIEANRRIGRHGSALIQEKDTILTHCNAGSLATVGYGTALAVVRSAFESGKSIEVIATETRPLLQGSRLTCYELMEDRIPVTLITDNMVGYVMSKGMVDKVVVGADRIVKDAVLNKIGTYTIAVLAKEHGIPFYVAAPKSTFDLTRGAKEVTVEERGAEEITGIAGVDIAPERVPVFNPAFDATPLKYVSAIICEGGVISPARLKALAS